MPIILPKHQVAPRSTYRDVRPVSVRVGGYISTPNIIAAAAFGLIAVLFIGNPNVWGFTDIIALLSFFYFRWALKRKFELPFKLPRYAGLPDPHNPAPGKTGDGKSDGILYLGNVSDVDDDQYNREVWLTNADARTHILYLGTTGSGKTEGLKSMVANSLAWGSGFSYTDGKADTDLWAALYSMTRRFGRDDDILALNYMTGNSDDQSTSNSMNPFSNGSSSYLANLVVNLMPDAGGDNAMWKERAVALMFALMPALTFQRDKLGILLDVGVVRDNLDLAAIIRLSRDQRLPKHVTHSLEGYLNTLPGFVGEAFDDEGKERPPSPDQPMYDLQVARQQHGYLSMQFTRAMQSLADEYGYIFKKELADIDVLDVVLNRRILVVLIPALEKSGEEAANLGKIVASCLKGMMGMTLGNTVEGAWETAIGSKQTHSNSSFMTVFDEVGYYTAQGMAVMAAQARSLGFSLVFASQDLPSMEKRIKQEAKSIVGNCNLKILGRIEDPTDTKDFVTKHGGMNYVMETRGSTAPSNTVSGLFMNMPFYDDRAASIQVRQRVDYDHLRGQREGEAHLLFGDWAHKCQMFHAVPDKAKALRVHRFLPVPGVNKTTRSQENVTQELQSRLTTAEWAATSAASPAKELPEIAAMAKTADAAANAKLSPVEMSAAAVAAMAGLPAAPRDAARNAPEASGRQAYGVSDDFEGMAAANEQPQPAAEHGGAGVYDVEAMPRTGLPPLYEGDQYAVEDLDRAPGTRAYAAQASAGFAGTDADLQAVIPEPMFDEDEIEDISQIELPESLTAMLAENARKLTDGLRGKGEDA